MSLLSVPQQPQWGRNPALCGAWMAQPPLQAPREDVCQSSCLLDGLIPALVWFERTSYHPHLLLCLSTPGLKLFLKTAAFSPHHPVFYKGFLQLLPPSLAPAFYLWLPCE